MKNIESPAIMVFELNLIGVILVEEEAIVVLLWWYNAVPDIALYSLHETCTMRNCEKYIYMPLWKENLCSDHNKFHRYQQNEQSPLILTVLIEHKKTMTYDVGNLCPGLGQTHRCDQVKLVNGIYWSQPFPLDNRVNSSFVFVCVRSRQSNSIVNIIHFMYSSSPLI